MSGEAVTGIGGVHIKPSARRSIHSNCRDCRNIVPIDMGRYGLNGVNRQVEQNVSTSSQEQGHDEVDNIMSKMVRPVSPVPVRPHNKCRRNSLDVNYDTSDDEDNILSKSSPAAFSIYSNEAYESANNSTVQQSNFQNYRNQSMSRQQHLSEDELINHSTNIQNNSMRSPQRQKLNTIEESALNYILQLLAVICVGIAFIIYYLNVQTKTSSIYDKISFYNDVKGLGEKYKVKDTSILQVRTGVATIFEKQDTGSFILAYNSRSNHFNPEMFDNFVEDIAAMASRYLRNDSEIDKHVVVDTITLNVQTEKEFMNEYEDGVIKTGVMLVKDVHNVPSQLAMAFHYFCDEYNPLVRRSAIFFTLNLSKCSNNSDPKSTHEYIEKCLAKKWRTVGEDKIGPLLTRVVNIVVDVTSYS